MKLTEEIDAMRTIGVSPMEALVVPRVFATVLMMPLLGFYAASSRDRRRRLLWIGAYIPPITFIQRIRRWCRYRLYVGLIKARFGAIMRGRGCSRACRSWRRESAPTTAAVSGHLPVSCSSLLRGVLHLWVDCDAREHDLRGAGLATASATVVMTARPRSAPRRDPGRGRRLGTGNRC
jgi:hypothetical protein